MPWIARIGALLLAGLLLSLTGPTPAQAGLFGSCRSNSECSNAQTCQPGFLGFKFCKRLNCNSDGDCPSSHKVCFNGACQRGCRDDGFCPGGFSCARTPGVALGQCRANTPSGGGSQSGGRRCGPNPNWPQSAPKNFGQCPGTQRCDNGICRLPLT